MADTQFRFNDAAAYERLMGEWSRRVGEIFLDWLEVSEGLIWLDVGCGTGAFSSLVVERYAPRSLVGIDPSEAQLEFARDRRFGRMTAFELGDAMQIDRPDRSFDIAVAALVMHFMPDPLRGVREMARVVRPGGMVATYTWDLEGGGFPYEAVHRAMHANGFEAPGPPHPEAGSADELARLWQAAGLADVATRAIPVARAFSDFDDYWANASSSTRIAAVLNALPLDQRESVRADSRSYLPQFPIVGARANAVRGRVRA